MYGTAISMWVTLLGEQIMIASPFPNLEQISMFCKGINLFIIKYTCTPMGQTVKQSDLKYYFFVSSETSVYILHSGMSCKEYVSICSHAALGDFDEPKRSSLTMFGVLTAAVRIYQDRLGYGIYSGPIGTAVFMITVKWVSLRHIRCSSYSNAFNKLCLH